MQDSSKESITYMTYPIEQDECCGNRYWHTTINGNVVHGTIEELIELIDEVLLK